MLLVSVCWRCCGSDKSLSLTSLRFAAGILADEMGLGKTLQSISILAYMRDFQNVSRASDPPLRFTATKRISEAAS